MSTLPPRNSRLPRRSGRPAIREVAPLCCEPTRLPTLSVQELTERVKLLEAQNIEAVRDIRRLYEVERSRKAELQNARQQMLAYADDLRAAFQAERARRDELERAYLETVRALACAIEARDPYTGGHVDRVASYATALGREVGLDGESLQALEIGALLHDIGKIAVADAILRKPGPLDEEEWVLMRQHPTLGASLVGGWAALQAALPAVLYHHERFDGEGYPTRLAGRKIPKMARIVAVADAFDAMMTDRPYRQGLTLEWAMEELRQCSGTQFEPDYAEAFIEMIRDGRVDLLKASAKRNGTAHIHATLPTPA